ncbi:MAG: bifunctional 5,10-methylene-tetrahydrofolate dehydrogenase/5,10-methylene-tetrahydrofolate cyclohydrolase [Bacteroidetes bacterium]|nr:bifunctional 5,10-methylene-tetrahydrofolate dehydrogenase/5,10-methylene-tetrahydrofolate cyclohydrolase [Bacteroidota bacterium]
MYTLISGKEVSEKILEEIKQEVATLKKKPHLAAILVGEDPASQTYVNSKIKACERVGITSTLVKLRDETTEDILLQKIEELNLNADIDGYIVQLPLPKHISEQKIIETIHPAKDVDGFHPINIGKLVLNLPTYISATPYGIVQLLQHYNIVTQGKHCVVIGRSNIVGTPMSILMGKNNAHANCTVTLCHSKTENLSQYTLQADIVIAAMGKAHFVKADMIKEGAVVIDVGINRVPSTETKSGFKLVGDVDFIQVAPKCSYITPVPGGVGLMTIVSLLKNTLLAAKKEIYS